MHQGKTYLKKIDYSEVRDFFCYTGDELQCSRNLKGVNVKNNCVIWSRKRKLLKLKYGHRLVRDYYRDTEMWQIIMKVQKKSRRYEKHKLSSGFSEFMMELGESDSVCQQPTKEHKVLLKKQVMIEEFPTTYKRPTKEKCVKKVRLRDYSKHNITGGKWCIYASKVIRNMYGETELESMWHKIKELVQKKVLYNSKCSTGKLSSAPSKDMGVIICYTPNRNDKSDIKRVADAIASVITLKKPMLYKFETRALKKLKTKDDTGMPLYIYTENGTLYENVGSKWKLLTRQMQQMKIGKSPIPTKDICMWEVRPGGELKQSISGGKWCIYASKIVRHVCGKTELESMWNKIKVLVQKKVIYNSKCSTGKLSSSPSKDMGVIICYTPNMRDKSDVKRVADAIAAVVTLKTPILYKVEKPALNKPESKDDTGTPLYIYTENGTMFEKVGSFWKRFSRQMQQVKIEEFPISCKQHTEEKCVQKVRPAGYPKQNINSGKWCIYANKVVRDVCGKTELQSMWHKIKVLVRKKTLYNSECITDKLSSAPSEDTGLIICYTPNMRDKSDIKRVADAIATAVTLKTPIFYKVETPFNKPNSEKDAGTPLYLYTENGTMYEKFGSRWQQLNRETVGAVLSPCDVVTKEFIWAKDNKHNNKHNKNGGKWLVFLDIKNKNDITNFDLVWDKVRILVEQGKLFNASRSTESNFVMKVFQPGEGLIMCHTPDFTNIKEVKMSADNIRSVLTINRPLFYKTNELSSRKKASWKGDKNISLYMHATNGRLMVRDEQGHWKPTE